MGTPSYMAPEQAAGKARLVGPAADVYALGAILYELLTGRPPFKGPTPLETIRQVLHEEPVPPGRLQPRVPRDVQTICLKCLHKEPGKRYGSATELAEDLARFLAGEPIHARPVSRTERLLKWVKRHPALAGVYSLLLLVLVLGLGGGGAIFLWQRADFFWQRSETARGQAEAAEQEAVRQRGLAEQERDDKEAARREADKQKDAAEAARQLARRISDDAAMLLAGRDWDDGNLPAMRLEPFLHAEDLHGFEWHYNWRRLAGAEKFFLKGHTNRVSGVAFSPDGKRIVSGSWDNILKVWDVATGQEVLTLKGANVYSSVAFSPDGKQLVSVGIENLEFWDLSTRQKKVLALKREPGFVRNLVLSPDGKRAVSSWNQTQDSLRGSWKTLKVWDLATGQAILTLNGHTDTVTSAAFSPDGRDIVSASYDRTAKVWDLAKGQEVFTLKGHLDAVESVAVSPDGRHIVSVGADKMLKVWDLATGQEVLTRTRMLEDFVFRVAFSPEGKRILCAGVGLRNPGHMKVWDAEKTWTRASGSAP
jgi:hypothetical protein